MLKRLLTFCAVSVMTLCSFAQSSATEWVELVSEGKEAMGKVSQGSPAALAANADGEFVVNATAKVSDPWDNQFWIVSSKVLPEGTKCLVSFDYKATSDAAVGTQAHKEPSKYLHWDAIGQVSFTSEWQHFEKEFTVSKEQGGMMSIAFNLNDFADANDYYFKNISWKGIVAEEVEPEPEPEPEPFVVPAGEIDFTTLNVVGTLIDNNIGKKLNGGDVVWGSQSDGSNYTDVTAYKSVKFYGTPGAALRLFVNRIGGDGVNVGTTEQRVKLNEEGVAEMNVAEVMTALGSDHCYLSSVKIAAAWQVEGALESDVTIKGITVVPAAAPSEAEVIVNVTYNEDNSIATMTAEPTQKGTQLLYTLDGDEETPEYMLYEGPVTLPWMEARADEFGICKYIVKVIEVVEGTENIVASKVEEVSLAKAIEPEETDLIEIAQDQGTQYDDFARAELVEGEEYNTYTVTQDLQIAFKMMDIDVKDCDYVIVKFAEPVAAGWKLAFWANQDLTDVPEGATEFKYELPADVLASGVLPQITMMTFFGGYTAPLVAKVSGVYKHSTGAAVGIDGIAAQKAAGIYTITGAKVNKLQKGINIVIDENGVAKKVIRK